MSPSSPPGPAASKLLARLQSIRRQLEGEPGAARRASLARELALELADVPAADRPGVIEQAMSAILPAAVGAAPQASGPAAGAGELAALKEKFEAARVEKETLVKERDALRATRDGLLRENGKLRADLDAKPATPPESRTGGGTLEAFRAGLKEAIAGRKVDGSKLGLAASDVRLFRLTQELVNFITMLEQGRMRFLNALEVGQAGMMGTQLIKAHQEQVRKQILAVLNDEEGSIKKLRTTLDAQNRFIIGMPDAFQATIPAAVEALLKELEPEPILERTKRLMRDYDRAWAEFARVHSDLSNLQPSELWDTYCKTVFQDKLSEWTKTLD
jgi:hypothetical protein